MSRLKLRLTVDVTYETYETPKELLMENLEAIIEDAVGEGRITGGSPAEVEEWQFNVKEVS